MKLVIKILIKLAIKTVMKLTALVIILTELQMKQVCFLLEL